MDNRLTPAREDLAAKFLEGKVAAKRYVEGKSMIVSVSATGLRRAPSETAPLDTELLFGEEFEVYETKEGWSWGQSTVDQYVGYIKASDLAAASPAATHQVTALRTYVYKKADLKSDPKLILNMGSKVAVLGAKDKFSQIPEGYIFSGHIRPLKEKAEDFVAIAEKFLGTPYLWGGRQSIGLDCSSLIQLALAQTGIAVLRDTDLIEREIGKPIEDGAEKQRGDMVFWRGHVGIMIDGEKFIHANATNMAVTIDNLADFAAGILGTDGPITSIRRL
jgi:cell wall-associated NlpC family hydrolase